MNNAGITTQYGFLFQRKAFILFALENAGTKQTFTFEGRDDIEISADESIYSVKSADASYIQVKSGTISESCFCKVICNWLLFDKESSGTVTLFAENQLDTLVSNITKDIIFDYIIQGKEKKRSSIAWKTYNKFQNLIETDREAFLGIIEKFLQIINISSTLPRTSSLSYPLITSSFSCTIFSDMVCCLLSNGGVATSFYQTSANHVSLSFCETYST